MKRTLIMLLAAGLTLTACTEQPTAQEPALSSSSTPDVAETAITDEIVAANIAEILDHPTPEDLPTGAPAVEAFTALLLPEDDEDFVDCPPVTEVAPDVAGFGQVTIDNDDDAAATQALAAFGFPTEDEAATFTTQLHDFVQTCSALNSTVEPLTHHTDEAFEIQVARSDSTASSLVILRDETTVLMASSTPPSDIALSLTHADQLQEMLR